MNKEKELELLNGQMIGIILFIVALFISLLIIYNEKLKNLNKSYFFSNKESLNISLVDRLLFVILGIYFVYNAIERKKIYNDDSNLQIIAAILALLASLIILYIIISNYNNLSFNTSQIEEPI